MNPPLCVTMPGTIKEIRKKIQCLRKGALFTKNFRIQSRANKSRERFRDNSVKECKRTLSLSQGGENKSRFMKQEGERPEAVLLDLSRERILTERIGGALKSKKRNNRHDGNRTSTRGRRYPKRFTHVIIERFVRTGTPRKQGSLSSLCPPQGQAIHWLLDS